jgi:hypothetical protein
MNQFPFRDLVKGLLDSVECRDVGFRTAIEIDSG